MPTKDEKPPAETKPPEDQRPKGWEKLRPEGHPKGGETGYCEERGQFYNVSSGKRIIWHEMPPGHHYDPEQNAVVPTHSAKSKAATAANEEKS